MTEALSSSAHYVFITLRVNNTEHFLLIPPYVTLLDVLRKELHLTGVKCGCDDANCGACTVLLDGSAVKSCNILAVQAQGKDILTIEGLAHDQTLHPLQKAFMDYFAIQCGFCTPGMILTAKSILDSNPNATEDDIRRGLQGNICRCTGYKKIVEAIMAVQRGDYGPWW